MTSIASDKQKLSPGNLVELFDLDLSIYQVGLIYRFCSSFTNTESILWQGNSYTLLPIVAEGFEVSGRGTLPTPTLKICNVGNLISAISSEFGDIIGATLTRWKTYEHYLDGGASADPNQHYPKEIWLIERKKNQNKVFVEFELSASIDQEGRLLPGRQILRDACTHRYRVWDATTNSFDYANATCPWAGSDSLPGGAEDPYFTEVGARTGDPASDVCGKKLTDCKLRFMHQFKKVDLPFRGFPSVSRIRG
jgi:lambda family phage minor tail protein L